MLVLIFQILSGVNYWCSKNLFFFFFVTFFKKICHVDFFFVLILRCAIYFFFFFCIWNKITLLLYGLWSCRFGFSIGHPYAQLVPTVHGYREKVTMFMMHRDWNSYLFCLSTNRTLAEGRRLLRSCVKCNPVRPVFVSIPWITMTYRSCSV